MALATEFVEVALEDLHREAAVMKVEGWRFMQTHAVNTDDGVDLYYAFMKDGLARNLKVRGVKKGTPVPSVTDLFLAAFVFENEARELFGVDMRDIAIDFDGAMYAPAESEPMTFITPEQKAAREKARKAAQAKAAKDAAPSGQGGSPAADAAPVRSGFVMTPERRARLDAKLATMSPEKVAKVEAALKAREAEAASGGGAPQASTPAATQADSVEAVTHRTTETPASPAVQEGADVMDAELQAKLASLDPAKAAKVRAALGLDAPTPVTTDAPAANLDAELEAKLQLLDPAKASKVRAALASAGQGIAKGGN